MADATQDIEFTSGTCGQLCWQMVSRQRVNIIDCCDLPYQRARVIRIATRLLGRTEPQACFQMSSLIRVRASPTPRAGGST
jgi:hypothetical protein